MAQGDLAYALAFFREFNSGNQYSGLAGETFLVTFFVGFSDEAGACFCRENTLKLCKI
jgi:hypothetical protein